jgi:hypothetical protein
MPRRHHRDSDGEPLDLDRVRLSLPRVVRGGGGEWTVRQVSSGAAVKTYRCPGCDHEITPGMAHVVAWPSDEWGGAAERRHWHTSCWNRGPLRPGSHR